jgi:hypothetical protein
MYAICRREQRTQCKGNTRSTDELRLWAEVKRKELDVQDDHEDIPMSYLLYVLLAIVGIVAGAIFVFVKML